MNNLIRTLVSAVLLLAFSVVSQAEVTVTYLHTDAAGSVVAASDESGDLVWRKSYLPYGGKHQDGQPGNRAVGYTGHTHDDDTGLIYMKARSYDPDLGRFIQMDPATVLDHVGSNPVMFNRFAYANNNPYRYVDPDGRNPEIKARRYRALAKAFVPKNSRMGRVLERADLTDKAWRATLRGDRKAYERAIRDLEKSLNKSRRRNSNRNEKEELPQLDSTGKVHGKLPKPKDLARYSRDELKQLRGDLKKSVQQRIKKNIELGSDKGHGQRQAAEQQLIKSIDKSLNN